MRYGDSNWHITPNLRRFGLFGIVLLFAVIAGLSLRHLRHGGPEPATYSQVFSTVQKDVNDNLKDYQATQNTWLAVPDEHNPQHIQDYLFSISSNAQPGIAITARHKSASGLDQVSEHLQRTLQTAGFTKTAANPLAPVSPSATQIGYQRDDIICTITLDADRPAAFLHCTDPSEQQYRADAAKPFVDSYLSSHLSVRPQDVIFGQLTVKSRDGGKVIGRSQAAGYDLAEAVIYRPGAAEGTLALFYKHSDKWQYVTESNMDEHGFNCAVIEQNTGASKAFIGQPCYDSTLQKVRDSGVILDSATGSTTASTPTRFQIQ